jgi:hypothetical protein
LSVFLATLGLLALAVAGALAVSPSLRARTADVLLGSAVGSSDNAVNRDTAQTEDRASGAPPPDLSRVAYERPRPFVNRLARGDLLVYSPAGFLYFVGETSGKVVRVDRRGQILASVATLPVGAPSAPPTSSSRVFLTSDVQGNVYVSHTLRRVVEKYSPKGQRLATIKGFVRPEAIVVDQDGNVYVVDFNQVKQVRVVRADAQRLRRSRPNVKAGGAAASTAAGKKAALTPPPVVPVAPVAPARSAGAANGPGGR